MDICRLLPQTKVPELVVSLVALTVLIVVKEINECYRQKLLLPIPIELIAVSQTDGGVSSRGLELSIEWLSLDKK